MPLLGEMLKFNVDERLSAQQCLQQLTDWGLRNSGSLEFGWESDTELATESNDPSDTSVDGTPSAGSRTPRATPSRSRKNSPPDEVYQSASSQISVKRRGSPTGSSNENTSKKRRQSAHSPNRSTSRVTGRSMQLRPRGDRSLYFSTTYDTIIALLHYLQPEESQEAVDDETSAVIDAIGEQMVWLGIDHLGDLPRTLYMRISSPYPDLDGVI